MDNDNKLAEEVGKHEMGDESAREQVDMRGWQWEDFEGDEAEERTYEMEEKGGCRKHQQLLSQFCRHQACNLCRPARAAPPLPCRWFCFLGFPWVP